MTSVDARLFQTLTVFDRTVEQIREQALAAIRVRLPELDLRPGTNEYVLAEAMALEVAEAVWAVNRVPQAVVEAIMGLLQVERDGGAPASTSVTFTFASGGEQVVPAGSRVRLDLPNSTVIFTLDEPAVGTGTATAPATATTVGAAANGTQPGTPVVPVDLLYFVESVELAGPVAGGRDPEGTVDWVTRGIQRLARLSETLVLPDHFRGFALEHPAVSRAHVVDLYNPDGGTPGDDAGHLTVVVYGAGGTLLPADKAALEADMAGRAVASLEVHVVDPTITTVDVAVTVAPTVGADGAEVQAAVEAAVRGWLDPQTWPWEGTVRFYDLVAVIEGVPGVDHIVAGSLELDGGTVDVALAGVGPLAAADEVQVQVA